MAIRRPEPNPLSRPRLQRQLGTCAKRELTIRPRVRALCLADAGPLRAPVRGRLREHVMRVADTREVNLDDERPAVCPREMLGPGREHRSYIKRC